MLAQKHKMSNFSIGRITKIKCPLDSSSTDNTGNTKKPNRFYCFLSHNICLNHKTCTNGVWLQTRLTQHHMLHNSSTVPIFNILSRHLAI